MLESEAKVPAALNLPFGKLFFGFNVVPYTPPESKQPTSPSPPSASVRVVLTSLYPLTFVSILGNLHRYWKHAQRPACSNDVSEGERKGRFLITITSQSEVMGYWANSWFSGAARASKLPGPFTWSSWHQQHVLVDQATEPNPRLGCRRRRYY